MTTIAMLRETPTQRTFTPSRPAAPVTALKKWQNRLLEALPEDTWQRLAPQFERVELSAGNVLYECGTPLKYVYFPVTSIISLLYVTSDGASSQVAMVGLEGVVGMSLFTGGETSSTCAVVQSSGCALRLRASVLEQEFSAGGALSEVLLRYTQSLLIQMAQTAVCNRHHALEQQLCRLLLMSLDRLPGSEMAITHEMISNLIGVRREGITHAAGKLQRLGLISYTRGRITVLNREALEEHVCECYSSPKRHPHHQARTAYAYS